MCNFWLTKQQTDNWIIVCATKPQPVAANQQAIDAVAAMVSTAKIPDQSGSSGGVDYSLTKWVVMVLTIALKLRKVSGYGVALHSEWYLYWLLP